MRRARKRRKSARRRIPELGRIHRCIGIVETRAAAAACDEHRAIGKQGGVLLTAGARHRSHRLPGRVLLIEVDDFRRRERRIVPADDQYFAWLVHHSISVAPVSASARRAGRPRSGTSGVEKPGEPLRPCVEHLAVGREHHHRVIRQGDLCRGQIAPAAIGPHLRKNVEADSQIDVARHDERTSIGKRRGRWVPAPRVHVREPRPHICDGVVQAG